MRSVIAAVFGLSPSLLGNTSRLLYCVYEISSDSSNLLLNWNIYKQFGSIDTFAPALSCWTKVYDRGVYDLGSDLLVRCSQYVASETV